VSKEVFFQNPRIGEKVEEHDGEIKCPCRRCDVALAPGQILCQPHWSILSKEFQGSLFETWERVIHGLTDHTRTIHLINLQTAVTVIDLQEKRGIVS